VAKVNDVHAARRWLVSRLTGDAALDALLSPADVGLGTNVWEAPAPEGTRHPCVVFQQVPGVEDDLYGDGSLAMSQQDFIVKGVVEGNEVSLLMDIASRIDALLHNQSAYQDSTWRVNCLRRETFNSIAHVDGKLYRQAGARYALIMRPAH